MRPSAFAIAACLLVAMGCVPAEARSHCRSGLMYRPSRGTCVSFSHFVRHVSLPGRRHRLAHGASRRGHARQVFRERIRIVRVVVERRVPVPAPAQVAEASMPSGIPYADAGERSLNPLPRMRAWSR